MPPKSNNFDLIRLVAALQVAVVHVLSHQNLVAGQHAAALLTRFFPGVPIFFFVSGFLIYRSYDKNPSTLDFTINRCLRIYPALIVCFFLAVLSVYLTGYFRFVHANRAVFAGWTMAQLSFLQFYNPDFMRQYGVGVLNGSMWTIGVELQFYVLTPVIHRVLHSRALSLAGANGLWIVLVLVFLTANRIYSMLGPAFGQWVLFKLVGVTFIPWIYMFLAGALVQDNFQFFQAKLSGKFLPVLIVYLAIALIAERWFGWGFGNSPHPMLFFLLAFVIFAGAFSHPGLSDRLLKRNDISYGVYIYHMPVINLLLATGHGRSVQDFWIAIATTVALAAVSWVLVEKPALSFKRHPLYSHAVAMR